MQAFGAWLLKQFMTLIGQWLVKLGQWRLSLWKSEANIKKQSDTMVEVIKETDDLAKDGLTEEEKNEIRKKKIAIEEDLFNNESR